MNRRATYALMFAVVVIVCTWIIASARDDTPRDEQPDVTRAVFDDSLPPELPALTGADFDETQPASPAPLEHLVDATVAPALDPALTPLIVRVTHADGVAAHGVEVELYDAEQHFLARARLDALGAWHHPAQKGAGVLLVLGATAIPERFELPALSGRHDLTLPDGEVVSGRLLVNGEAPGERVPLSVRVKNLLRFSFRDYEGRPQPSARAGRWPMIRDVGLLTDDDGSFRISGLSRDAEVRLDVPLSMKLLTEESTALPVRAPASDVWLAASRRPVLRGRILGLDGQPSPEAELRVGVAYHDSPPTPGEGPRPFGGGIHYSWHPVDEQARFEISLAFEGSRTGRAGPDGETIWNPPPRSEDLEFTARDPEGNWLTREFVDIDSTVDHDLGDLMLQPVQRWRLRVVDEQGEPVPSAQLRPTAKGPAGQVLRADDHGRIDLDLGPGRITTAMLLADDFEARLLEYPATAPDEIEELVLTPSTRVELRLHGAWDDERFAEGWDFSYSVFGAGPVFHDAQLARRHDPEASGVDEMRADPLGSNGSSWGSNDAGDVKIWRYGALPTMLLDGLRAHHPITLAVAVRRVPEGLGPASDDELWTEEVWLERGQLRVIDVDLSEWFPPR